MDRARRRQLRELNERVWNGHKDVFAVAPSLDSTLKRNTAFIKRLRMTISPTTLNTFLLEIKSLSLSKYLSEIISACYEGLCKLKSPGEVEAGVEVVSALHQRFGPSEFTEYIGWLLGKGMATPDKASLKSLAPEAREKEEKDRLVRQRNLLRVVTELWLVGVLRTLDEVTRPDEAKAAAGKTAELKSRPATKDGGAEPFPLEVLKDLLGHDREHANLPLLVTFVKTFSWDILGLKPSGSDGRKAVEEDGATKATDGSDERENETASEAADGTPFASPELQERFRSILKRYFEDVRGHLIRDQKAIFSQGRKNQEAYVKSGEVFEDRQANFEKQVKAQERLVANAQVIADMVGAEMPDLKDLNDPSTSLNGSIGLVKAGDYLRGQGDGAGIWEDEEERRFYENLVDLKGKVPGILLEEVKKKKPDTDEQVGKRIDAADGKRVDTADGKKIDTADSGDPAKPADTAAADDQSTAIANKTIGAQVDALLVRLPDLINKDVIDQTAIDFCFLNSKASRNRLVKALTDVPKGRADLLPGWSRLIATLGQYMPDIPKGVIDYLDAEFRSLQRRKDKEFLSQVRLSNIRYLAELTKFGIVPEHVVFHCLRVSLDDFSRMNIEIISNLLENCGRYLLRTPETSPSMASFLETLQRKKSVQHLGQTENMLIENAVYYVDPPPRPAIEQKERTPMDLFIRKMIYEDLTKRNYTKALKMIRRLHWEEKEVVAILHKVFSRPHKIKYGNIHILAILLSALYRHHAGFVVGVIDAVVESICLGLEQNDFELNQRRIAEVKYLGELYDYRLLEHPVVFDTMYRIMTFGYGGSVPVPGRLNPFDLPDDFFRIRLVTTILETCGMFFTRGAAGKKLDSFLSFFQYYIYTKNPLPMDIEFLVQDMFALTRPQWKIAPDIEEAARVFQQAIAEDQKSSGLDKVPDQDDGSSESLSEEENADDGQLAEQEEDDEEEVEDNDQNHSSWRGDSDVDERVEEGEEEEESIVVTREEDEIDPEEEAEFEREYARMMAESLDSRKTERKPQFDLPLPARPKNREPAAAATTATTATTGGEPADGRAGSSGSGPTMAFSLLTKRGNRQQTRTMELPSDSHFVVAMRSQQQAENEEKQRIKNLVLNYDLRDSEEEDGEPYAPEQPLASSKPNIHTRSFTGGPPDVNKPSHSHSGRFEGRSGNIKGGGQRVRRLQLSDVDWYGNSSSQPQNPDGGEKVQDRNTNRRTGRKGNKDSDGDGSNADTGDTGRKSLAARPRRSGPASRGVSRSRGGRKRG